MSAPPLAYEAADPAAAHPVVHHDDAPAHGTRKGYLVGFALSLALTAVPFALVAWGGLPRQTAGIAIVLFAVVQVVVQMVAFLHLSTKSEGGWTFLALIFTAVLVFIALSGTLWVMFHLNANMMPMQGMPAM